MSKNFYLVFPLLFLILFFSQPINAVVISGCLTISGGGLFELNQTLDANGADCLRVNASNVVIDLNLYNIENATGANAAGIEIGILEARNMTNITIQNGTINNSAWAVFAANVTNLALRDLRIANNSNTNGLASIDLRGNTGVNLTNVTLLNQSNSGALQAAVLIQQVSGLNISQSTFNTSLGSWTYPIPTLSIQNSSGFFIGDTTINNTPIADLIGHHAIQINGSGSTSGNLIRNVLISPSGTSLLIHDTFRIASNIPATSVNFSNFSSDAQILLTYNSSHLHFANNRFIAAADATDNVLIYNHTQGGLETGTIFENNTFQGNTNPFLVSNTTTHLIVRRNNFTSNEAGFLVRVNDLNNSIFVLNTYTCTGTSRRGLNLNNSVANNVTAETFSGCIGGNFPSIELGAVHQNNFTNINITYQVRSGTNIIGIRFTNSNNNNVTGGTIAHAPQGIRLISTNNTLIRNVTIVNSTQTSLVVRDSSTANVTGFFFIEQPTTNAVYDFNATADSFLYLTTMQGESRAWAITTYGNYSLNGSGFAVKAMDITNASVVASSCSNNTYNTCRLITNNTMVLNLTRLTGGTINLSLFYDANFANTIQGNTTFYAVANWTNGWLTLDRNTIDTTVAFVVERGIAASGVYSAAAFVLAPVTTGSTSLLLEKWMEYSLGTDKGWNLVVVGIALGLIIPLLIPILSLVTGGRGRTGRTG